MAATYGIFQALFFLASGRDQLSTQEYYYLRKEPYYKVVRTTIKISIMFFIGAIMLFPLLLSFLILPVPQEVQTETMLFFQQIHLWPQVALLPNSLLLVGLCTVTTFTGYYFLAAVWPKESSFEMWAGVIALLEPMMNIYLGVTFLNENFPISWFIITIILLFFGIIVKYLSETESQVNAIVFLKLQFGYGRRVMVEAYKIRSVRQVLDILGEDDFMLSITAHSHTEFTKIILKQISALPGLISYKVVLVSQILLDRGMPDSNKGDPLTKRVREEEKE